MTAIYVWFIFIIPLTSIDALSLETPQYEQDIDTCKRLYFSCKNPPGRCYCRCDSVCNFYDDCCFDADTGVIEDRSETFSFIKRMTCEPINFYKDGIFRYGVFMLSTCLDNWQGDETKQKCLKYNSSNLIDIVPVTDTRTNLTYKNRHCAKCNHIQDVILWKLNISCKATFIAGFVPNDSLTMTVFDRINSPLCSYRFVPFKEHDIRYCYPFIPNLIDPSTNHRKNNSSTNRALVPIMAQYNGSHVIHFFRNLDFLLQRNDLKQVNCLAGPGISFNPAGKYTHKVSTLIDISVLLYKGIVNDRCRETEAFLSDQIGCRQLYCPFNTRRYYGTCVQTDTLSPYAFEFLFQRNSTGNEFKLYRYLRTLTNDLLTRFDVVFWLNEIDSDYMVAEFINGEDYKSREPCSFVKVQVPLELKPDYNKTLQEIQWQFRVGILTNYSKLSSSFGLIRHVENVENASCKVNRSVQNPRYIFTRFPAWTGLPCAAVRVDNSPNSHQSRHVLPADMESFYINGINIKPTNVLRLNGHFYVCLETFLANYNKTNIVSVSVYRYIVNAICTCVSISGLICCLIHYCIIPSMVNQKSQLMIVLICFLSLAHTCVLLNTITLFRDVICVWLGAIQHFAWLGSFVFMFLCSFRLNYDIRKLHVDSGAGRNYFSTIKYCMIGFISTSVIVLGTKSTEFITNSVKTIYGGNDCFIVDTYTLLFAFVVPVSVILCGNLVLFCMIIYYISSTSIVNANKSKKSNIVVYAKISASMGFSWILGIVAVITNFEILLMMFEIMANLQGTFLSISILWNVRVKKFYDSLFTKTETLENPH